MDKKSAADILNNSEYRTIDKSPIFAQMKQHGLVAIYGYSDDGVTFNGAFDDEGGMSKIYLDANGIMRSECEEGSDCPYFKKLIPKAFWVKRLDGMGAVTFDTNLPHECFTVMDDGDVYCIGIVISVDNL